ncbi:MAG: PIN domain-containing protein [Candidatus Heimdallarchaeota archaeon]
MPLEVILDTNIIIYLSEGKFNLNFELERLLTQEFNVVILSACIAELEILAKREMKMKKHLLFLEKLRKKITVINYNPETIPTTDEKIIAYATKEPPEKVVVTNDKDLKKKLRKKGVPVIFVRKKTYLQLLR